MSQLRAYIAGCLSVAVAVGLTEAIASSKTVKFDEITVGRINIVEPDGTKRLIISSRAQFPGDFSRGKETTRPDRRDVAGILFINDEGTENGGLVQNGKEHADGTTEADLSLTFDRFRQDQSLQLTHSDEGDISTSAVKINDVPSPRLTSIDDLHRISNEMTKMSAAEKAAYAEKLRGEGRLLQNRAYLGTTKDHNSELVLSDAKGRPRLRLAVSEAGEAQVQMLDESGNVTKQVLAADLHAN